MRGPCAPSATVSVCHSAAGRLAATAATLWGTGSPATSWGCVGLRPRPDHSGTATWAAWVKTGVILGTSST